MRKIKDLPKNQSLTGVRFRYPGDGRFYYWTSQWSKGVWAKKQIGDTQVFPLFCADIKEVLEWELA